MPGSETFAIQLSPAGLSSWHWALINPAGIVVSRGQSDCQDQARRRAFVRAQALSSSLRVD